MTVSPQPCGVRASFVVRDHRRLGRVGWVLPAWRIDAPRFRLLRNGCRVVCHVPRSGRRIVFLVYQFFVIETHVHAGAISYVHDSTRVPLRVRRAITRRTNVRKSPARWTWRTRRPRGRYGYVRVARYKDISGNVTKIPNRPRRVRYGSRPEITRSQARVPVCCANRVRDEISFSFVIPKSYPLRVVFASRFDRFIIFCFSFSSYAGYTTAFFSFITRSWPRTFFSRIVFHTPTPLPYGGGNLPLAYKTKTTVSPSLKRPQFVENKHVSTKRVLNRRDGAGGGAIPPSAGIAPGPPIRGDDEITRITFCCCPFTMRKI